MKTKFLMIAIFGANIFCFSSIVKASDTLNTVKNITCAVASAWHAMPLFRESEHDPRLRDPVSFFTRHPEFNGAGSFFQEGAYYYRFEDGQTSIEGKIIKAPAEHLSDLFIFNFVGTPFYVRVLVFDNGQYPRFEMGAGYSELSKSQEAQKSVIFPLIVDLKHIEKMFDYLKAIGKNVKWNINDSDPDPIAVRGNIPPKVAIDFIQHLRRENPPLHNQNVF